MEARSRCSIFTYFGFLLQWGGRGGLVITNNKTIHLDTGKFRSVDVDVEPQTVGLTSALLAWSMVGNIVGGKINLFQGTKGHTCDNLLSAQLVTGTGDVIEVLETPIGPEKELFNQLKEADPRYIMVMFSRDNFVVAAELWEVVSRSPAPMIAGFVLMTAPPRMPNARQPVVLTQASYLGPQAGADKAFAHWNDTAIAERAITVRPGLFKLTRMNMQRDAMMTKGSNMDCYNSLVKALSGATFIVLQRGLLTQAVPWDLADEYVEAGCQYGRDILEVKTLPRGRRTPS
ncbi:hypothetical protein F4679DRAFT_578884 [Xylaria curta]|nr:hypothetical protein F4679DRAFT_578884 [Xylaria curta]